MKLTSLNIREDWNNKGQYIGEVSFKGRNGSTEIRLNTELSQKVLEVLADEVVAAAKEVATVLTRECIEAAAGNRLEHDGEADHADA